MSVIQIRSPHWSQIRSTLQVVVIDNFYDLAVNQVPCDWLDRLFRFKVTSFLASYPYGMMSFGAADLVGTHWLLCQKDPKQGLVPLMGLKTTDHHRTGAFRIDYPGLGPVQGSGLTAHRKAVIHELAKADKQGYALGYMGSWVVSPLVHKSAVLTEACRKATSALYSRWVHTFDMQAGITFAALRFRVEKFHAYLGLVPLEGPKGERLSDFKMHASFDELLSASILYRKNHSAEADQDMADLQDLWDRRIVFAAKGSPLFREEEEALAARAA